MDQEVPMYDVAVVGARCAGSPTAMLLARKGYRVLLVDRAEFPSDTISTHFIHAPGVARLERWGLLDEVVASGCPSVPSYRIDFGPFALKGSPVPIDGVATAYAPRRAVLDKILVDAAVRAGAELREGFSAHEICFEDDRAAGLRGRTRNGTSVTEQTRLVVGADGLHSPIARMVGAPIVREKPAVACAYYTYWSGVSVDGVELYPRDGRLTVAFPTNNDLVCTFMAWPREEFHAVRSDTEGQYMRTLELIPGIGERIRAGKRAERFLGSGDLPNFFRKAQGAGWALVGDAGCHKDPNGAHGISDAFRDAELLAEAVDSGLSGRQPLEKALAEYEERRYESSLPAFELNFQLATLKPPPPELQALFGALRGNQPETDRLIGALTGTVPIPEFFSPGNIERILGAAS
jgi:flavin-dependent dehydrogenase